MELLVQRNNDRGEYTPSSNDLQRTVALLDQVRGVLFSKSNIGADLLVPVSTLAIRHSLLARNVATDIAPLLAILNDLRDIQSLQRGHWLPVHSKAIPCGDCALLVSGKPTAMLGHDYGIKIETPGLGRLIAPLDGNTTSLPTEPLSRWLAAPTSTAEWYEQIVRAGEFGEPSGVSDMEAYDHWSPRTGKRWLPAAACDLPDGVILARHVHSQTRATNHYLLRVRDGTPKAMHELPRSLDSRRMAIALRGQADNPIGYALQQESDGAWILHGGSVPKAELRLLRAIGPTELEKGRLTARPPATALIAVRGILTNLGLREWSPGRG